MTALTFEAWTEPGIGDFEKIRDIPVVEGAEGVIRPSEYSDASFPVMTDWGHFTEIISGTNGSLIRVKLLGQIIDEYYIDRLQSPSDRPSQRTLSGGQIAKRVESSAVYPYLYPNHAKDGDWIWDGDNLLRNGDIESNPTHIVNPGAENAELEPWSLLGSATAASINDAGGADSGSHYFEINPTAARDGISQGVSVYPRSSVLAPTYTVTLKVRETTAGGSTVRLALSADDDASVVTGTKDDTNGEIYAEVVANDTWQTLTVEMVPGASQSQIEIRVMNSGGSALTFRMDTSTIAGYGVGLEYWEPGTSTNLEKFEAVSSPVRNGSGALWLQCDPDESVFQRVTVDPGGTYTATVWARDPVGEDWALQIRTTLGNVIAETTVTLAANTWTEVQVTATLPNYLPGGDEALLVFVNDGTTVQDVYLDDNKFSKGFAAATPGEIIRLLVEDAQARGELTWLDISSFSDTLDSNGNAWLSSIPFRAFADSDLGHALSDIKNLGDATDGQHQWRVVPKSAVTITAGNPTHDLEVYIPGSAGTDHTTSAGSPTLTVGTVFSADGLSRIPEFTTLLLHGADDLYLEVTDATLEANFDRRVKPVNAEYLSDTASLQSLADALFAEQSVNLNALRAEVRGDASKLPLIDYSPLDTVWWQFPGIQSRTAKPVREISWRHGPIVQFSVSGSRVLTPESAMSKAVDFLLREFKRRARTDERKISPPEFVEGTGVRPPFLVVAASNAPDWVKAGADYTCDGVDDEEEVQAAIDSLSGVGWVVLSAGQFNFETEGINLPSGVSLSGVGIDTLINATQTLDSYVIDCTGYNSVRNFSILSTPEDITAIRMGGSVGNLNVLENLEVTVQGTSVDSHGIWVGGGQTYIHKVVIDSSGEGITADGADGLTIQSCRITAGRNGLHTNSATGFQPKLRIANSFISAGEDGVNSTHAFFDSQIVGNQIAAGGDGVSIDNWTSPVIEGNIFDGPGGNAIDILTGCLYATVVGNVVRNALGVGIRVAGSSTVVGDNIVLGTSSYAIEVSSTSQVQVEGNMLISAGEHGIFLQDVTELNVFGNFIKEASQNSENTYDGIHLTGTSLDSHIHGNKITSGGNLINELRYGINIADPACVGNIVVGNDLATESDFATAPLQNLGVDTQLFYPEDTIYGDNFVRGSTTATTPQVLSIAAASETESAETITPVQP